jgi:hypothetical protein
MIMNEGLRGWRRLDLVDFRRATRDWRWVGEGDEGVIEGKWRVLRR